jgi:hypothetical protein
MQPSINGILGFRVRRVMRAAVFLATSRVNSQARSDKYCGRQICPASRGRKSKRGEPLATGSFFSAAPNICLYGSIACVGTSRPNFCFVPMHGSVPQRDLYRAHALECLEEARAVKNRELCNIFHRLAMWWVILAHQTEDDDCGLYISGGFGSMTSDGDTETSPGTLLTLEGAHQFFRSHDPASAQTK